MQIEGIEKDGKKEEIKKKRATESDSSAGKYVEIVSRGHQSKLRRVLLKTSVENFVAESQFFPYIGHFSHLPGHFYHILGRNSASHFGSSFTFCRVLCDSTSQKWF